MTGGSYTIHLTRPPAIPRASGFVGNAEVRQSTPARMSIDPPSHPAHSTPPTSPPQPQIPLRAKLGPLTAVLIGLSVAVGLWTQLGGSEPIVERFLITAYLGDGDTMPLDEIRHGQFWRLITPIFLHFSLMHILFNMMCLKNLGTAIEWVSGSRTLLALTLIGGIGGNVGQFMASGPAFGGMSGVVYALFGYIWMKAKFDPGCGFRISNQGVYLMLGWLVLCMTGVLGPIANYAHGIGLVVGMIWGATAPRRAVV